MCIIEFEVFKYFLGNGAMADVSKMIVYTFSNSVSNLLML